MGPLVDRLAAYLRSSPDAERPIAGFVGGWLWCFAGLATLLMPLLPHLHATLWPGLVLVALGANVWGLTAMFLIDWRRAPGCLLPLANLAAVPFVALVVHLTG